MGELKPDKVVAALAKIRKAWEGLGEALDEADALLKGDITPAQQTKAVLTAWAAKWTAAHRGEHYVINWPKDTAIFKRLMKSIETVDLLERVDAYLAERDPFVTEKRHPLGLFAANVNKYAGRGARPDDDDVLSAPPADCRHVPRCRTDVQCTRRG